MKLHVYINKVVYIIAYVYPIYVGMTCTWHFLLHKVEKSGLRTSPWATDQNRGRNRPTKGAPGSGVPALLRRVKNPSIWAVSSIAV